jgi:hypothetical protein
MTLPPPLNGHHELIPYVLDDGNKYKNDIIEAKRTLASSLPSLKTIEFCSDTSLCALQAADVVTWSVRRQLAGTFPSGFEPFQGLFDKHHLDLDYKEEWMVGVADLIRKAEGSETNGQGRRRLLSGMVQPSYQRIPRQ